jgi:nicotinamidase-related amidase
MSSIKIISVDFQKDFSSKEGHWFKPRPSVKFVKNTLIPFFIKKKIKVAEIISDYRQPRLGDPGRGCYPGENGFISEIPNNIKLKNVWIKCMNSPIWVRKNIGNPDKKPGLPYQDPKSFTRWLYSVIGRPEKIDAVVLIGLTVDCCVSFVAQELTWRGYKVKILKEAVDTFIYSGKEEKQTILKTISANHWAEIISWNELKEMFAKNSKKRLKIKI